MTVVQTFVNDRVTDAFDEIVTAGWANKSDGTVDSPVGFFAVILLIPKDINNLYLVFEDRPHASIYPGSYVFQCDSDGNSTVVEYLSDSPAIAAYNEMAKQYAIWSTTCDDHPLSEVEITGRNEARCKACNVTWNPEESADTVGVILP